MNSIVHFEIQADLPDRAIRFYSSVFGWTFKKWEGTISDYWMINTGDPEDGGHTINGGLLRRPAPVLSRENGTNAFVCTMEVADFDEVANRIVAAGGEVALPKFAIPGMAWQGYFLDTEQNTFGIHQPDTQAK